jgi:hypothetical protein
MQPHLIAAPHILCYINGKKYGNVYDIKWRISQNTKSIRVVDQLTPVEEAPTAYEIQLSLGLWRSTRDGGIEAVGLAVPQAQTELIKYNTIMLVNRTNGKAILKIGYAMITDQSWGLAVKQIMTGQVTIKALIYASELG